MPLIKDGQIVEDAWSRVDDEDTLPGSGDVIVSLERFHRDRQALNAREGRTGILLGNDVEPEDLTEILSEVDLIALHFPAFTDGRAYSQAYQLRTQLGYEGELRATGDVLADQASFLLRVGFDSFEVDGRQSLETWTKAEHSMSVAYQRGYQGGPGTRYQSNPPAPLSRI